MDVREGACTDVHLPPVHNLATANIHLSNSAVASECTSAPQSQQCHVSADGLCISTDGKAHGVMLMNSNGMDVAITETKLQYRVIGGVLDFYFLMGPTPLKVI